MAKEKKKKGLLGKALDSVSAKDEKEALAKAEQEKKEAEAKASQSSADAAKAKIEANEAEKRAADAEAKAAKLEAELEKKKKEERAEELRQQVQAHAKAKKPKAIAEHEVASGETLGHIAQKYYNHATKPYYMLIYEANKDVIGDNPNKIKPGMKFSIPELPEDMK